MCPSNTHITYNIPYPYSAINIPVHRFRDGLQYHPIEAGKPHPPNYPWPSFGIANVRPHRTCYRQWLRALFVSSITRHVRVAVRTPWACHTTVQIWQDAAGLNHVACTVAPREWQINCLALRGWDRTGNYMQKRDGTLKFDSACDQNAFLNFKFSYDLIIYNLVYNVALTNYFYTLSVLRTTHRWRPPGNRILGVTTLLIEYHVITWPA